MGRFLRLLGYSRFNGPRPSREMNSFEWDGAAGCCSSEPETLEHDLGRVCGGEALSAVGGEVMGLPLSKCQE